MRPSFVVGYVVEDLGVIYEKAQPYNDHRDAAFKVAAQLASPDEVLVIQVLSGAYMTIPVRKVICTEIVEPAEVERRLHQGAEMEETAANA